MRYNLRRGKWQAQACGPGRDLWCARVLTVNQRCCRSRCCWSQKSDTKQTLPRLQPLPWFTVAGGKSPSRTLLHFTQSLLSPCELERDYSLDLGHGGGSSLKDNKTDTAWEDFDYPQPAFGFSFIALIAIKFGQFNPRLSLISSGSAFIPSHWISLLRGGSRITEDSGAVVKPPW